MTATNQPLNLRQVCRILFRHKGRALLFFVAVVGLVAGATLLWPKTYQSQAKLYIRPGRESVGLDPTATLGQTLHIADSREREINSVLELLKTYSLFEKVVDRLGVDTVLEGLYDPATSTAVSAARESVAPNATGTTEVAAIDVGDTETAATEGDSTATATSDAAASEAAATASATTVAPSDPVLAARREKAAKKLMKTIECAVVKGSGIITLNCKAESPELARDILVCYLEAYRELHLNVHRNYGSLQFFEGECKRLKGQLEDATAKLRDAKNAVGVASIAGQRNVIETVITALDRELASLEADLAGSEEKLKVLGLPPDAPADTVKPADTGAPAGPGAPAGSVASTPAAARSSLIVPTKDSAASAATRQSIDLMRSQLYTLQVEEQRVRARFTADHPQVKALREQVQESEQLLRRQEARMEHSHSIELRSKVERTREQREEAIADLRSLNQNESKISEAERVVEQLATAYRTYLTNREQARINGQLAEERITNVQVAQPPNLVLKHVSPKALINLSVGLVVALLGAVAVAFLSDILDHSIKSPDEAERLLGVPVLVTIPRLPAAADEWDLVA